MRRMLLVCALLTCLGWPAAAQPNPVLPAPPDALTVSDPELVEGVSAFGLPQWQAVGTLTVAEGAPDALADLILTAEVLDAEGELIGEGFGAPVDACGLTLRPDAPLQPGEQVPYLVSLELDDDALIPDSVVLTVGATPVQPAPVNPFATFPDVRELFSGEVVRLEWTPEGLLRFAVGCELRVFTAQAWYEYDPVAGDVRPIDPPNGEALTPALLRQLELEDPADLDHAKLQFHPNDTRLIYQDRINTILTTEADGSYTRLLWDFLSRISLQGYVWLGDARFLAYYYGAYGDAVRYFTASTGGQRISVNPLDATPSLIVPGASPDGARVVIAIEREGETIYRYQSVVNPSRGDDLFVGDAPGNNFPPPVVAIREGGQTEIYVIREEDGAVRLQCVAVGEPTLNDLALLPLRVAQDERGLSALSPDGATLALAADGRNGGVWLVDIGGLGCGEG